ncbi:two-component system sensor histidine kinase/response regulator [Pelomonas sp. Root662]|nr:two-component system sensor histidine kinase/response regulator [Pelomonas sp. Root662]
MLAALSALRDGDFTIRLPNSWDGVDGQIAAAFNQITAQEARIAAEVARLSATVGKEGRLKHRMSMPGSLGGWAIKVESINTLMDDLVRPTAEIARTIGAVAKGDLGQAMELEVDGRELKGEFLRSARLVNTMIDQLSVFTSEVTRVAREVGTEGKLGGQAQVKGVSGVWKDLTDSVNQMAGNLTAQVRNIADVTIAVANGDLSKKITVDVRGEILQLKEATNTMVDQLRSFASEVTRVAREVGTDGRLGGQAVVPGVAGTWKDLTDSVNAMATNLTAQVRNIATVTTAVARGDLSRKITVDVKGEILELKETINTMVDQLNGFSSEVTRVAREVGTEGKLGGQAQVKGVSGTWKDLTDNVNSMASNLTGQVRNIADVATAVANGDLSKKITVEVKGEILALKNTMNTMVDQLNGFAGEVSRVAREVGTDGKLGGQAQVPGVAGTWKDLTDNVNFMASNLTGQVRNIAEVTTAVANGDLSKKITVDVRGEILELKNTINTMVDQLGGFASEVTRVAREVGTDGKLGGQAQGRGVAGIWKDLTDSVNAMATNLTAQVRNIADVTTAVANGDLSKKITVDVRGEILELKNTINTMVDQLNGFAGEVSRVAREVGTDGKLGGQAQVPGVAGTWKDLTDNVNSMASNLTGQVRNIADVATAVANGDLSKKITADAKGEILELKNTLNTMVDQLNGFASEVSRVAREVGTEGKLGGQAAVPGVAGVWKDLTDNVNFMASNLTGQVRNIADVATAIARGDLSSKITVEVKGEILALKNTLNTMVDQLNGFASEVTRVAREVGTDGKLGGQAVVPGVAGTWKDLTDSVNAMATNLTGQVRNIAEVTTAVANGDLSKKITVDVRGEILELKDTINTMVDQLNAFAGEVTRVAREVGTEGKLGGQAQVPGVAGTWKDLTDNVNSMASNLTGQVRNIADVTIAVANGDLSKKITVDVRGEILQLSFASEVTRVAREVGTEGKLGGQAAVPGVAGVWKDLTDNVNSMASNLTGQVRNIADVATAIARGDLSRKITVDVKGEILELKQTMNTMVEQLGAFASEVSRVAREVGTEGKLGGQAQVPGVAGTWKDLTDNVNSMASNLTGQVRNIADVTIAVANGDLSKKITVDVRGEILQLTRVAREVGTEGRLGVQAVVPGVAGTWKDLTDSVNTMGANLTAQVRNIAEVTTAVARGDLNRKITVDVSGEILELKNTINTMVDQLNAFAGEVTRVAREVGTEGKLGGQAQVAGVGGTWKDLTDNVNFMASNLTEQVRGIVKVVTAVANGNLTQRLTVQAKGEVAALADTINNMTDTLATFAEQVTNVAREVGVDGRLGGQAHVPGAAGTWKDLTGNVNLLAANLTTQVRAIAEVATAVTKGDLTRAIQVEAKGEVSELKDNINTMISNLRETTERNREQDWLKTNLARFTGMLQGQRELQTVSQMLLTELAPLVQAHQGTIYHLVAPEADEQPRLRLLASYAQSGAVRLAPTIELGEGLVGQCALDKRSTLLADIASDFVAISSSLGSAPRVSVIVLPVLFEGETKAVIELATLQSFSGGSLAFLELLTQSIGAVFNTIEATMRTESLLAQSQQLTVELQSRQSELQETNEQLGTKARLLAEQNAEVERKNTEVEQARHALEDKAAELALTSKYKSEFLANMSHELRTPLNSILILSQQLASNNDGNLSPKQVEFSRNINSSGSDLLHLINDILDLSKIESGTVTVDIEDIPFASLRDNIDRNFRQVAEAKNLPLRLTFADDLPRSMESDAKRLQQILKNLLSNAVKFTAHGHVELRVSLAQGGWSAEHPVLSKTSQVLAFAVEDTGIGVAPEKQRLIFEAFQQADAGTSRKYGGTGLGLAISRELAALLGGEIRLASVPGQGSTFTLYLPLHFSGGESPSVPMASPEQGRLPAPPQRSSLPMVRETQVADDRDNIEEGDSVLLIVEDDPHYARIVLGLARDRGFKGLVALKGGHGLELARRFKPTAVSLDIFLPDMLGWTVLNQLKLDPLTRHIPVQVVSVAEEDRNHGLAHGAFSYVVKAPTSDGMEAALDRIRDFAAPRTRRLLVIEDNDIERQAIVELLGHDDIEMKAVGTGAEAMQVLREERFDCIVLDLRLPDVSGFGLLEQLHGDPSLAAVPVVVFTGKDLSEPEQKQLRTLAKSVVLKDVQSPERLLDETALFLHRVVTELPQDKQDILQKLHGASEMLRGRRVLVVDDDARNIFALTTLLENQEMQVLTATSGRAAIDIIQRTADLDLVLMDIMMPDMDGYETMKEIRSHAEFRNLPILALTAKAMKGDREKCLEAGASDYISKPVNTAQLLSLMRVWLYR